MLLPMGCTGVMQRTLVASQATAARQSDAPLAQPLRVSASAVALPHPEKVRPCCCETLPFCMPP